MKTKFLSLFAFLTLSITTLLGQVNLVDSFRIEPISPSVNDDIDLFIYYNSVPGCNINFLIDSINYDTIRIVSTINSNDSLSCPGEHYPDTVSIGKLNSGAYILMHELNDIAIGGYTGNFVLDFTIENKAIDSTNLDFDYSNVGLTYNFYGTVLDSVNAWEWDFGDSTQSTQQNPVHVYPKSLSGSVVQVCITATYVNDSIETICKSIFIPEDSAFNKCNANFNYKLTPSDLETPLPNFRYQFYDNSQGDVNQWFWDFGDGDSSTLQNPVHYYIDKSMGDSVTVCLSIFSDSCSSTICKTIILGGDSIPSGCSANFTYELKPITHYMLPTFDYQFYDNSQGNITDWLWTFGDGDSSTLQNPFHQYDPDKVGNSVTVCLSVFSDSCSSSSCKTIIFEDDSIPSGCNADFTYELMFTTDTLPYYSLKSIAYQFYDSSQGDVINWFWDFGDGSTSTLQNPSHTYNSNAFDSVIVSLTIYTLDSCNSMTYKTIIFNPPSQKYSILGTVYTGHIPLNAGVVIAYTQENYKYYPAGVDIVKDNGKYKIDNLTPGKYIVYALPNYSTNTGYFPTYYVDNLHWKFADVISLSSNLYDVDIDLIKAYGIFGGSSQIKGKVIFEADSSLISALVNIPVIIATKNGEELSSTSTGTNGSFEFNNLLFGEYLIYPEIPNFESANDYIVTLSPENPTQSNVQLIVRSSQITTHIPNYNLQDNINLTYVPKLHSVNIVGEFNSINKIDVQIINSIGTVVMSRAIGVGKNYSEYVIDVQNLINGLYIVKVSSKNNLVATYKFIK